ncbi:unnamed protein product [Diatraea saccharalis]|uniref:MADF domain-containing protein n=1 Tax=Diatraea saccharalis TaxID=40085 RepID=A0A9N9W911_9NEOP|nr:unnamed protein product [Diatraea saccharalis]
MDSANNSSDMPPCFPKIEMDAESDRENKRDNKMNWTSENTRKLIEVLEKDCKELWDSKHPLHRDRWARQTKNEYLANIFGTTPEEISRKIHNLRTQLNNELRKIKRRQSGGGEGSGSGGSGWEYFDALSFLLRSSGDSKDFFCTMGEPVEGIEGVNLELAEFQANEEEEFGIAARARSLICKSPPNRTSLRVAASAPPPVPLSAHPMMWHEDAVPKLRPGYNADECQIFGDFVASELRMLRSDESRKRLKRVIQKAILQIGEEEDMKANNNNSILERLQFVTPVDIPGQRAREREIFLALNSGHIATLLSNIMAERNGIFIPRTLYKMRLGQFPDGLQTQLWRSLRGWQSYIDWS